MSDYKCAFCGYTYRPSKGDWTQDVKVDTIFEDLPEFWKCPTCGQPKMAFEELKKE